MLIHDTFIVQERDLTRFAWANLRRFHNTDYSEAAITHHHGLNKGQRINARKQAAQLRYCLIQAREYFEAGERVTLATRPALFYYGAMSLALAEILLKQTGDASLDRAREEHKHHGLILRVDKLPNPQMGLQEAAGCLAAVPLIVEGKGRRGTFDLWHRSAREMPLVALVTRAQMNNPGSTLRHEVIAGGLDQRLPKVSKRGFTLYDCLRRLPCMISHLDIVGEGHDLVRGKANVTWNGKQSTTRFTFHPAPGTFPQFANNFLMRPCDYARVTIDEIEHGALVSWRADEEDGLFYRTPASSMWNSDEVHYWLSDQPLNEFGYLYFALYILGNYARYYPDRWMQDVDRGSPLALAADELLSGAAWRVPLLSLSELARTYYIPAA